MLNQPHKLDLLSLVYVLQMNPQNFALKEGATETNSERGLWMDELSLYESSLCTIHTAPNVLQNQIPERRNQSAEQVGRRSIRASK